MTIENTLTHGLVTSVAGSAYKADQDLNWAKLDPGRIRVDVYANIGAANATGIQEFFFAADQRRLYHTNGTAWTEFNAATATALATARTINGVPFDGTANITGPWNRNAIINGDFNVWQRGASFTGINAALAYTADRWGAISNNGGASLTVSRAAVTGADATANPNSQYAVQYGRANGNAVTSASYLMQAFESVNSIPLAGKTVTLSFFAKGGTTFLSNGNAMYAAILCGTGNDQSPSAIVTSSWTNQTVVMNQLVSLTANYTKYSFTATIPATAGGSPVTQVCVYFAFVPVGAAGASDWLQVGQVQLEIGSAFSGFECRPYQSELNLCRRYAQRVMYGGGGEPLPGYRFGTNRILIPIKHEVEMRTSPSLSGVGGITTWTTTNPPGVNCASAYGYTNSPETITGALSVGMWAASTIESVVSFTAGTSFGFPWNSNMMAAFDPGNTIILSAEL